MSDDTLRWLSSPRSQQPWAPPAELAGTHFARRRLFVEANPSHRNTKAVCPACGYPTLRDRVRHEQCALCHWEDDGQDDPWADQDAAGPNHSSLALARMNFAVTLCVWAQSDAADFSPCTRRRLFSEEAVRAKCELCALFDELTTLADSASVAAQWQRIDAKWREIGAASESAAPRSP